MIAYLIGGLFGAAFVTALYTIVARAAPQAHRFRALFRGEGAA